LDGNLIVLGVVGALFLGIVSLRLYRGRRRSSGRGGGADYDASDGGDMGGGDYGGGGDGGGGD
jgi:hypothetical protein